MDRVNESTSGDKDPTSDGMRVAELSHAELAARHDDWLHLYAHALEPNVFYSPMLLEPALGALVPAESVRVVVVERTPTPQRPGRMIGLFPLTQQKRYRGVPARVLSLLFHDLACVTAPLVHEDHAAEAFSCFFQWARESANASLVVWPQVPWGERFGSALLDFATSNAQSLIIDNERVRALLVRRASADAYLEQAMGGRSRKKLRRQRRTLESMGALSVEPLEAEDDVDAFTESFLSLEASGWKGRAGTAMGQDRRHEAFFTEACRRLHARGELDGLAMRLDGKPIAMLCNFVAHDGSYAFKTAFDERYKGESPGVQLELESIRRFHDRDKPIWMDSATAPGHKLMGRIWMDRRTLATVVTPVGRGPAPLVAAGLPLWREIRRMLSRRRES